MACNKCGSTAPTKQCGCGKQPTLCGCRVKVGTECVDYNGVSLTPLGVVKGDKLEYILKCINDMFGDIFLKLEEGFKGTNVGFGSEIYKGLNADGKYEFRTLEGGSGIILEQKGDIIEIKADTEFLNDNLKDFLNEAWFKNHFKTLIKQDWFTEYLQSLLKQTWFENLIQYWIRQEWFRDYLEHLLTQDWHKRVLADLLRQAWFVDVLKEVLNQPWFIDLLCVLFKQPWFVDGLKALLSQQWFKDFLTELFQEAWFQTLLNKLLRQQWFKDLLNDLLRQSWFRRLLEDLFAQQWFIDVLERLFAQDWFKAIIENLIKQPWFATYLMSLFKTERFKQFFASYFLDLINGGYIDICAIIQERCDLAPKNEVPTMSGVVLSVANRAVTTIGSARLTASYLDPEGDAITHIAFEGDVAELTIGGQPVVAGVKYTIAQLDSLVHTAVATDSAYTKVYRFKGFNNKNQETNVATLTINVAKVPDTEARCICLTGSQTVGNISLAYNTQYTDHQVGTLVYKNGCDTPYTINRTLTSNISGLTFVVRGTVGANQSSVALPVYVNGRVNNLTPGATQAISGTTAQACGLDGSFNVTLSGNIVNGDNFANCIVINNGQPYSVTDGITKGQVVNKQIGSITFTNRCESTIDVPETVFIDENGLKVFIPAFSLPKGSVTKTITVQGTYNGDKTQIVGVKGINGVNATVTINVTIPVTNTPPVTRDVVINLPNRTNTEVTRANLDWSDAQNDSLQAVRFKGDVSSLFTNPERTTPYVANTELAPTFTLYFKAPDQDPENTYVFQYDVKAGDQWSV